MTAIAVAAALGLTLAVIPAGLLWTDRRRVAAAEAADLEQWHAQVRAALACAPATPIRRPSDLTALLDALYPTTTGETR